MCCPCIQASQPSLSASRGCTCNRSRYSLAVTVACGTPLRWPRILSYPDIGSPWITTVLSATHPSDIHAVCWIIRLPLPAKVSHRPLSANHSTPRPPSIHLCHHPPNRLRRHAIPATLQGATHEALTHRLRSPLSVLASTFLVATRYTYGLSSKTRLVPVVDFMRLSKISGITTLPFSCRTLMGIRVESTAATSESEASLRPLHNNDGNEEKVPGSRCDTVSIEVARTSNGLCYLGDIPRYRLVTSIYRS